MNKRTFALALLTASLLALSYWSWKKDQHSLIARSVLRLSLDNAVESLDPAKAFSDDSLVVSGQVLEPLYQYHYLKRPYELQPLLAEGMPETSPDEKTITVRIRKGILFHPHPALGESRELTAHDFVTQIKRIALKSTKSPGRSLFSGVLEGFDEYDANAGGDWRRIPSVPLSGAEANDRYTLVFHLKKIEPSMIYFLALNFLAPVPWELVEATKNDLDKILVGTGPYFFSRFNGQYFELLKNKNYRQEFYPSSGDRYANVQKLLDSSKERLPFIDEVRFYVTKEADRWSMFLNHTIDVLSVPKTYIPEIFDKNGKLTAKLQEKKVELKHFPILANRWLAFNMRDSLVGKNRDLRLAIAHAIDTNKYIQETSQNTNLRANSILAPGIAGYDPTKELPFHYDPKKARLYLEKAGFHERKMPTLTYSTRGTQTIHLREGEIIKSQLEALGLRVEIEVLEFPEFLRKGRAGELQLFTDNWLFDYPDGENILQLLYSGNAPGINKSGYANPSVDELYRRLRTTSVPEAREAIFRDMEERVLKDLPWIPLMYESSFVLQYPEVKNFRKSSLIRNYVKYLKIGK